MNKLDQNILRFIDEKKLIKIGDKILVALSGGPDSVFLLYFLIKYKQRFKIDLGIIHINHMLRSKEALLDEKFCRALANDYRIPFHSYRKNIKLFSKKNKISIEEAGRIIRYSYFDIAAGKFNYTKIATAHNCNDNTETVFLNLIKGTGLRGISGIPAQRGNIIRPILNTAKEDILKFLKMNDIQFRIDKSNLENDYERNFLRNEILPLLTAKLNPSLNKSIFNSSELFKDVYSFVLNRLENEYKPVSKFKDGRLFIDINSFLNIERGVRTEYIKLQVEKNFLIQLSLNDLKKIISLNENDPGEKVELSQNFAAIRDRKEIIIYRIKKTNVPNQAKLKSESESLDDHLNKTISIKELRTVPEKYSKNKKIEYISGDNISGQLTVRKWRNGDRFFPLGLKGSKKVSDFLTDQKISPLYKKDQLVLTDNENIIWVVGLRIDNRFKIKKNTEKVLELCLK